MSDKRNIFTSARSSDRISILRNCLSRLLPLAPLNTEPLEKGKRQIIRIPDVLPIHEDFLKADPNENSTRT